MSPVPIRDIACRVHDLIRSPELRNQFRFQAQAYIVWRIQNPGISWPHDIFVEASLDPEDDPREITMAEKYAILAAIHDDTYENDGPIMPLDVTDHESHVWYILRGNVRDHLPRYAWRLQGLYDDVAADGQAAETPTTDGTAPDDVPQQILRIINHAGREMERHASTFANQNEEALRDHFLTVLTTHFPSTTGETFNKSGKTDILVRDGIKNLLVAECKIWDGPKRCLDAIDQVLSYLTCRDSGAALVIFVKNKDFSRVRQSVEDETPKHGCFISCCEKTEDSWQAYHFHLPDDPGAMVQLAVLMFHFPD